MADRKTELDAFVEEMMAYAREIRFGRPVPIDRPVPIEMSEPPPLPPIKGSRSEREEIEQRIANFRAHQRRVTREREDYAEIMLLKMRASLRYN